MTSSMLNPSTPATTRGAFVLLEGVDRCGKTTQSKRLVQRLLEAGIAATAFRFPNRTTASGRIINEYLQNNANLPDQAIHLLFSVNRWEAADELAETLRQGTTVVCDRYSYSGVAFSMAKDSLESEWCQAPDRGLPAPDCVLYLDLSQEEAEKRGEYGDERYEKREMQLKVRKNFMELRKLDEDKVQWSVVDAAQTMDQVEEDIWKITQGMLERVNKNPMLKKMWQDGEYNLQKTAEENKENS